MSERYNGWTNHETWNVALWLHNESATADDLQGLARSARDEYPEDAAANLAESIESYVTSDLPDMLGFDLGRVPMMFGDMLQAALDSVDWYEIAETELSDLPEQED